MKFLSFVFALSLFSSSAFAQSDYLEKMAEQVCECTQALPDTLNAEAFKARLGVCMIEAAMPYKKQLKRDHDIDFDRIEEGYNAGRAEGEKLGRLIGGRLATSCPDMVQKMAEKLRPELTGSKPQAATVQALHVEGTVMEITDNQFISFLVKDYNGRQARYFWLFPIKSSGNIMSNYKNLLNKDVYIEYEEKEAFDPLIQDYKKIFIIKKIVPVIAEE